MPYDINIFIDSDCIAYGDLNRLFGLFEEADDFCCFVRALPLDDKTGWFEYENLGELRAKVDYVVGLHGGIYYIRKTEKAKLVLDDAKGSPKNIRNTNSRANLPRREMNLSWRFPWQ